MSTVSALIFPRFRKPAERVAPLLAAERYQSLFLDLPEDLTPFVREYVKGERSPEMFWRRYGDLTGLHDPFINALRYRMEPVLDALTRIRARLAGLEVYCYQDLACHVEASRLAERLLLLETGERVRKRIRIGAWRALLRDELKLATEGLKRMVGNVAEEAARYSRNAVLYGGLMPPFKRLMETRGFRVKPVYLHRYWRNPLDALRTMLWIHGLDEVPDDILRRCVQGHLRYLDYVLSSEDIDAAHERWTVETPPYVSRKPRIGVCSKETSD